MVNDIQRLGKRGVLPSRTCSISLFFHSALRRIASFLRSVTSSFDFCGTTRLGQRTRERQREREIDSGTTDDTHTRMDFAVCRLCTCCCCGSGRLSMERPVLLARCSVFDSCVSTCCNSPLRMLPTACQCPCLVELRVRCSVILFNKAVVAQMMKVGILASALVEARISRFLTSTKQPISWVTDTPQPNDTTRIPAVLAGPADGSRPVAWS
jgi:hypothetical protein